MSKTAIQIIRDAYAYTGICPTKSTLNDKMSQEGLDFLNELLYAWNMDNYFPFTSNTIDGDIVGGEAEISPESNTLKGEVPAVLQKVFWRNGSIWEPLYRVSYENIWSRRCSGATLPTYYAFTLDENGKGRLTFDSENGHFRCRVIYNRSIPTMDYNSELNAPPQYEQLLKYGIAVKVCIRYGVPADVRVSIEQERDSILTAIKKVNNFKHEVNIGSRTGFRSPADLVNGAYRI